MSEMTSVSSPQVGTPASRTSRGLVNRTVLRITARGMLGRRRGLMMFLLPVLLLVLAALVRGTVGQDVANAEQLLSGFAMAVLVPLLGLIAGSGAISPEIDDGSIVYLLAKPVRRATIVISKVLVAAGCTVLFAAVPVTLAGLIMAGTAQGLALGYGVGALVAGFAYSALFVLLGIVSRHAMVIGLIYVLMWEGLLAANIGGAKTLSVSQWGTSVAGKIATEGAVDTSVNLTTAVVLLIVVTVGATWFAGRRLRVMSLPGEE